MKTLSIIPNAIGHLLLVNSRPQKLVQLSDIIMIEGRANYSILHLKNQKNLIYARTLQQYEQELIPFGFFRVHRGFIVNAVYVRGFSPVEKVIKMDNNLRAAVSRRRGEKAEVKQFLRECN